MTSLILLILAAIAASTSAGRHGFWMDLVHPMMGCDPPKTLRGVVKLVMYNNIRNDDDVIDGKDFAEDLMYYDYDNNPCRVERWEWVHHWKCEYGYSERYARWFFDRAASNATFLDISGGFGNISFPINEFRERQYDRLAIDYCKNTVNFEDPLCDKVKEETREMVLGE